MEGMFGEDELGRGGGRKIEREGEKREGERGGGRENIEMKRRYSKR